MILKILFVEPPKDYWFLMGEYLPPPTGLLVLAAYIEQRLPDIEISILDCQAEEPLLGRGRTCALYFSDVGSARLHMVPELLESAGVPVLSEKVQLNGCIYEELKKTIVSTPQITGENSNSIP